MTTNDVEAAIMEHRKVVLDTDPGIDDAIMMLQLAAERSRSLI